MKSIHRLIVFYLLPTTIQTSPIVRSTLNAKHVSQSVEAVSRKIFNSLVESDENATSSNIIISPLSLYLSLSMLYHAAENITKQELESFLQFEDFEENRIEDTSRDLLSNYGKRRRELNTTIELANGIFIDNDFDVIEEYQSKMENSLFSNVQTVDFLDSEDSADSINRWVENKTHDLISDFLSSDEIDVDTRMLLLNVIYFKANWMKQFEELDTTETDFYLLDNGVKRVETMLQIEEFLYSDSEALNSKVISLPYEDENFSMLLFLPNPEGSDSLQHVLDQVLTQDFNALLGSMNKTELQIGLPKFKLGYRTELRTTLENIGVESLFGNADLSKLSAEPVQVDNILHETMIEVNEEGAEAAGVTGSILGTRSGVVKNIPEVNFNRPFLFVIQDQKNNVPLFIGKIVDPAVQSSGSFAEKIEIGERNAPLSDFENLRNPDNRFTKANCTYQNLNDFVNTSKVVFPCSPKDTAPIEEYKEKFGDTSEIGVNGEVAELRHGHQV